MAWITTYLGLGANLGDPVKMMQMMRRAAREIEASGNSRILAASSFYRTKPWGVPNQPDFINAVLKCETQLEPDALLTKLKEIEQQLGRKATYRWGPRALDIDILLYGNQTISKPGLSIPHPGLLDRSFVIIPLLEIEYEVRLPTGELIRDKAGANQTDKTVERLEPF